jgi:hypothetical protein
MQEESGRRDSLHTGIPEKKRSRHFRLAASASSYILSVSLIASRSQAVRGVLELL